MFGCINAGASEYLIKPLRADVIRTLPLVTILLNNNKIHKVDSFTPFQKLHRHQPTALLHHRLTDTTTKDSM